MFITLYVSKFCGIPVSEPLEYKKGSQKFQIYKKLEKNHSLASLVISVKEQYKKVIGVACQDIVWHIWIDMACYDLVWDTMTCSGILWLGMVPDFFSKVSPLEYLFFLWGGGSKKTFFREGVWNKSDFFMGGWGVYDIFFRERGGGVWNELEKFWGWLINIFRGVSNKIP